MPDLWRTTQEERQAVAVKLYGPTARALPLTTGLWYYVRSADGQTDKKVNEYTFGAWRRRLAGGAQ